MNENQNKLTRQHLPKDQALDKVTDNQVIDIQYLLNQRPRKALDFKTSREVYNEMTLAT